MKNILDVSNIVYTGQTNKVIKGFPVGGIRKVLGLINAELKTSDFIICFDGGSTLKKELLPTYKAGRVPDYSVIAQIDLLKEILIDCNIPFYFEKGYEADDWIYSFCNFMGRLDISEDIVIRSNDHDLACCVSEYVTQKAATSDGKIINRENFSTQVVRGKNIPYNTLLLWKIFHGDASDNYGALKIPGLYFETVAHELVKGVSKLIEQGYPETLYTDKEIIKCAFDECCQGLSENDKKKLEAQIEIVVPKLLNVADCSIEEYADELSIKRRFEVELEHLKICSIRNINKQKFAFYCSAFGLNRITGARFDEESEEGKSFLDMMQIKAKELSQGDIAVKYSKSNIIKGQPIVLENMNLPIG